ncbi:hypothetical protein HK14_08780 [Acetobacter cibinongensis]|uniref:Uncharacterized protein n=1 Tax=Acetobacter cibinongensis TaxID=146475 RepID=A0A1Z5YTM4_9PROT|nr:hypothetical protein HK14_08780 [Acetobacter cibinongensis]
MLAVSPYSRLNMPDAVQIRAVHHKICSPGKRFELSNKSVRSGRLLLNIQETKLFHIANFPIKTEKLVSQCKSQYSF